MKENHSEEINLLQLILGLLNWLKKMGIGFVNLLGNALKLNYRQFAIFFVVIGISVAIGQYLSRKSVRVYRAEAMALIYGSDAQTVMQMSRQLENASSNNQITSLASKLSLPDSIASSIDGLYSYYVIDCMNDSVADIVDFDNNHSLSDTTNIRMTDRVYFRLETKNIAQVPLVQAALLKYFNNNDLLRREFDIKKKGYLDQISICESQSKRIDSLSVISYFRDNDKQLRFDNDKLIIGEQEKQLFYSELLKINKAKVLAQNELTKFKEPIYMPSEFVVMPIPTNGRLKYGIYSLVIGYILSLLIALLFENYKKIFKYLKD